MIVKMTSLAVVLFAVIASSASGGITGNLLVTNNNNFSVTVSVNGEEVGVVEGMNSIKVPVNHTATQETGLKAVSEDGKSWSTSVTTPNRKGDHLWVLNPPAP